jgi:hypothetical protein
MMTRISLFASALLVTLAACGGDGMDEGATDTTTVAVDTLPKLPRVVAIDLGLAADSMGHIVGGVLESFPASDTVYVSVRTQYTPEGTPVTVRLLRGEALVQSVDMGAGAPNADSVGMVAVPLDATATASAGGYRIEVLLDGASQGIREITIGN